MKEYIDWCFREADNSIENGKELNKMKADIKTLMTAVFPEEQDGKQLFNDSH